MLCENGEESQLDSPLYAAELKADGTHVRAKKNGDIRIFGRPKSSGEVPEYTDRLPELIESLEVLPAGTFEVVGEAVVYDEQGRTWFEGSQRRCSTEKKEKIELYRRKYPILLLTFDITELDGVDLKGHTYEARKQILFDLLNKTSQEVVQYLPHVVEDKRDFFNEVVGRGEEGVILKRRNSRYERRRSRNWLKVKKWLTERVRVVGFTEGTGSRAKYFGSLVVARVGEDGSLVYRGKVGTGFTAAEVRNLHKLLVEHLTDEPQVKTPKPHQPIDMELEVTVKFFEETKNGVIRFPSLLKDARGRNLIHYETTLEPTAGGVVQSNLKEMLRKLKG
jgi:bifunctional non-homologous end joining protein LigD